MPSGQRGLSNKILAKGKEYINNEPRNPDWEASPIQILNLSELSYAPIAGRVIWNWHDPDLENVRTASWFQDILNSAT
jgi:hypothetical protein